MKNIRSAVYSKFISLILVILMLNLTGCTTYFTYNKAARTPANIESIGKLHKYFIVHSGEDKFALENISLDTLNLSGTFAVPKNDIIYNESRYKSYKSTEKNILNEVHIYLSETSPKPTIGTFSVPIADIKEIRIIEKDHFKTIASYTIGTGLAIGGILVILMIIVLLTKSSCPYVYSYDGGSFIFEGEIFGGAIAKNLERDDYMPLPSLKQHDGEFRIRISNELKERQYTDIAELLVIDHDPDQKVLLDKNGQPQLLCDMIAPQKAASFNGNDLNYTLQAKDDQVYFFNDENYLKNGVNLKFKKPLNVSAGKLVLNAKNTLWFDYIFGKFLEKFGGRYDDWTAKQAELSKEERMRKIEEIDFPLSIYAKTNNEWRLIEKLYTIGPLASRDFVIPIDLTGIDGEELEIKLETGFMFWEIDHAAIDFTENKELEITFLKPFKADGTGGHDWTFALSQTDEKYMAQESTGDVTEITFKAEPSAPDKVRSAFLHTRGYYELVRDFTGLPEITELNKFKKPGYFSEFSRSEYLKALNKENTIISFKPAK
jgi:hypothetical protein